MKRFRCALCRKLRVNVTRRGGDGKICRGCSRKVDGLVLRLEREEGYNGPHVYAGGIARVRVQKVMERGDCGHPVSGDAN